MPGYLLLFLAVFGNNLLPAFGPPTWSILVFFTLKGGLDPWLMVPVGAAAAASGRFVLALGFRHFATRLSAKSRANLASARAALEARRHRSILALGLFALSPLPSAQLFAAAGMAGVRLLPFTLAFFAGRMVSYSLYVWGAVELKKTSFGETLMDSWKDPVAIAIQVALLVFLVAMTRIDWSRYIPKD
ncbi:hypothetical protein [Sphingomicrobium aestuariivivum]|uniref:hypothetical protein n=1 Tax=Sphingomicrobium aestuariivivum TaxID=1582356 RepID=UPI001FD6D79B|nr:hypothetical protein [Sphingomicrobium aestuariivivum]MCJ8190124.1 hypothetical protein [Sphingomicrobium aestuariivivum]